jgi:hypothetical protein
MCYWLDLQTLGSQLVMPTNLPDHCIGYEDLQNTGWGLQQMPQ